MTKGQHLPSELDSLPLGPAWPGCGDRVHSEGGLFGSSGTHTAGQRAGGVGTGAALPPFSSGRGNKVR